jgi:hypothetical protein
MERLGETDSGAVDLVAKGGSGRRKGGESGRGLSGKRRGGNWEE